MIPLARIVPAPADRERRSPNHGERGDTPIRLIVLHATADRGNEEGAESWMQNPGSQVSAHLLIRRDGSVTRLVPDQRRAWHAGHGDWPGVEDINSASLGWEIANRNDGREEYTEAQYQAVAHLLRHYLPQGLTRSDVVGHHMVDPRRKTDPDGWRWDHMWRLYDALAPDVVAESLTAEIIPPNLDRIIVPTPEHIDEAVRVSTVFTAENIAKGIGVVEVILRGMQKGNVKSVGVKLLADTLSEWLKTRAADAD